MRGGRPSRSIKRFFTIFAMNSLVARLPPLPIEVTGHCQGFVSIGAGAFALLRTVGIVVGIAMPIEARKLIIVVILNVDAVAREEAILDQPVTTFITRDFYLGRRWWLHDGVGAGEVIQAETACGHTIFIPSIGQSSATITTLDSPIYAKVVFIWVRA